MSHLLVVNFSPIQPQIFFLEFRWKGTSFGCEHTLLNLLFVSETVTLTYLCFRTRQTSLGNRFVPIDEYNFFSTILLPFFN